MILASRDASSTVGKCWCHYTQCFAVLCTMKKWNKEMSSFKKKKKKGFTKEVLQAGLRSDQGRHVKVCDMA